MKFMKRIAGLMALALGFTLSMAAQDNGKNSSGKGTEMTGTLCGAKCVKQDSGKAACDSGCTAKSKDIVFIDEQGKATKVANPGMAKGKMGQKVKIHGEMMQGKDEMKLYDVVLANAG
jgi:hypothetical protein